MSKRPHASSDEASSGNASSSDVSSPHTSSGNAGFVDVGTDTWTVETELGLSGLTVLFHPKPDRIGERAILTGLGTSPVQGLSRHEPLFAQPGSALGRPLGTKRISRSPILVGIDPSGGLRLDPASSRTSVEINQAPLLGPISLSTESLRRGVVLLLGQMIVVVLHRLETATVTHLPRFNLVGESSGILKLRQDIDRVAELGISVLLQGEPGAGKRRAARALHRAGARRDGPFVAVDLSEPSACSASALKEAWIRAQGGTLYLNRVDQIPAELQTPLIRILESHQDSSSNNNGDTSSTAGARVISAAAGKIDKDHRLQTPQGPLQSALSEKLAEFIIRLPSLRHRRDDFGRLFAHFLTRELQDLGEPARLENSDLPWMPATVWAQLANYSWPGNIKQLRDVARRLVRENRGQAHVSNIDALTELNTRT